MMTPATLKQHLSQGSHILLCDVRTKLEFETLRLKQAKHTPLDRITGDSIAQTFPKDKPIVFICQSGARSQKAMQRLQTLGYTNVDSVEGGTAQCVAEGLASTSNPQLISLERQVRIAAGCLILLGVGLALTVHIGWIGLSGFVGAGLVFAGITNTCGMALMLANAPWNR